MNLTSLIEFFKKTKISFGKTNEFLKKVFKKDHWTVVFLIATLILSGAVFSLKGKVVFLIIVVLFFLSTWQKKKKWQDNNKQ